MATVSPLPQPSFASRKGSVRAALFAGAVLIGPLVTASGCGRTMYGGPPPVPEPPPSEGVESTEASDEASEAVPEPDPEEVRTGDSEDVGEVPVPAYGGPAMPSPTPAPTETPSDRADWAE